VSTRVTDGSRIVTGGQGPENGTEKGKISLATNYVLIDFENVQPKNLEILSNHPFKVLVFVGASGLEPV